jgi:hypothetical protein
MKSDRDRSQWKNSNVIFCHSSIDDAQIPKGALRILLHLQRRVGKRTKRNANKNPSIESIAKACRMKTAITSAQPRSMTIKFRSRNGLRRSR